MTDTLSSHKYDSEQDSLWKGGGTGTKPTGSFNANWSAKIRSSKGLHFGVSGNAGGH